MHIVVEEGGNIFALLCTLIITMKGMLTLEDRADMMRLTRTVMDTFKSPGDFEFTCGIVHLPALYRVLEFLV